MSRALMRVLAALGAVALALLSAATLSAPTAAADDGDGVHWILRTPSYRVSLAGHTVHVRVVAAEGTYSGEGGSYTSASMYVFVHSTQRIGDSVIREHDLNILSQPGESFFTHSVRHGMAHVKGAWDSQGVQINLRFAVTRTVDKSCGGGFTTQRGRVTGAIRFAPVGSSVPAMTTLPTSATLVHRAPRCGELSRQLNYRIPSVYDRPCLFTGVGVEGRTLPSNQLMLMVTRADSADTATIRAQTSDNLGYHFLKATVPSSRLTVADDLSSVALAGEPGTRITGSAQAQADPSNYPPAFVPSHCNGSATGAMVANSAFAGDLAFDFGFGGIRSVADIDVDAYPFREAGNS